MRKRKSLIILLLLPLLLAGCQSYKKVPYLQDALQEVAAGDTGTADMPLYDARIMPKDLLTIVVSCPEEPELAIPFNLTVTSPLSKENNYLTNQPTDNIKVSHGIDTPPTPSKKATIGANAINMIKSFTATCTSV